MNATVWGLVGLVVGVGVAVAVCRLLYAARSAAVVAERDLPVEAEQLTLGERRRAVGPG